MYINTILQTTATQIKDKLSLKQTLSYSLLGGDFGAVCYLYYYSRQNKEFLSIADDLLQKVLTSFKSRPLSITYCNGISGFAIGLELLENDGFISNASASFDNFDKILTAELKKYLYSNNYDFLHGYIGIAFYFLMRYKYNKMVISQLDAIVEHLYRSQMSYLDKHNLNCIYWNNNSTNVEQPNCSLSHGVASIAVFLSKYVAIASSLKHKEFAFQLLEGIMNFYYDQALDFFTIGSCMPTFHKTKSNLHKSRLGWCYGDLGIAISLLHVAKVLKNKSLKEFAVDILVKNATYRLDPKSNVVLDPCICHGATGIYQIFKYAYQEYNLEVFKTASIHWEKVAIKQFENAQYKSFYFYNTTTHRMELRNSILEGNAGCGLAFFKR
jgi:hypothetical protein